MDNFHNGSALAHAMLQRLHAAIAGCDLEALELAIMRAELLNVSNDELEKARVRKVALEKEHQGNKDLLKAHKEVLQTLEYATMSRDVELLAEAIKNGEEAGLEDSLLGPARRKKAAVEAEEKRETEKEERLEAK
eukprot:5824450-Amphidinium_carterae.1